MSLLSKNRTPVLFFLLCLLALGYSFFEWLAYQSTPRIEDTPKLAEESVAMASDRFKDFVFDFTNTSTAFTEELKHSIKDTNKLKTLFREQNNHFSFWGSAVFKDGEKLAWRGFVPDRLPLQESALNKNLFVSIDTDNNVTFLYSIVPFFVEEQGLDTRYDVYNRVKLSQENILSLGTNLELSPNDIFTTSGQYPVNFDFNVLFEKDAVASLIISTANADSLGRVYALEEDFKEYVAYHREKAGIWRALFLICFLLLIGALTYSFSQSVNKWTGLFIQLTIYTCIWLLIKTLYPLINIQALNITLLSNIYLVNYSVNSVYTLLISFTVSSFLISMKKLDLFSDPLKYFVMGIVISSSAAVTFFNFLSNTFSVITNSSVPVLDLQLLPSLSTLIFYLCSSTTFTSLLVLFIVLIWFILKNSPDYNWQFIIGLITGVFSFIILSKFTFASGSEFNWMIVITSLFFFLIIVFSSYLARKTRAFLRSSKLRLLIFLCYLAVCFIYISYASGNNVRQHQRMLDAAKAFSIDEESEIQSITVNLLLDLSNELTSTPQSAFNDAFFDQFVEGFIQSEWLKYTISVQIIDENGEKFTDYTTSLSPPQWSTAFRIAELEIPFEDEQIRRENLRPVLRRSPINTINANYSSFIRGWIPIFESQNSNKRIGWVLCSVYEELPQLNRPLRTVINSQLYNDWEETLLASEYENGIPIRSSLIGIPLEIPEPSVLPENTRNFVEMDSVYTTTYTYGNDEIKELYVKKNNDSIVRIAAKKTTPAQHIFSFLRLFFVLITLGIIFMMFFSWSANWQIFGHSRSFKDRLIDRFLLASLVCLLTLVGASYFVLNMQNNDDVRDQLFSKLENLVSNLESEFTATVADPAQLQRITSILDIDAALYQQGILVNSTTSQIYSQHLLPTTVPWDVYTNITNNESNQGQAIVEFDGQKMMIGYKPWLDQNNQVAGIAAIPTFLKAPKFYERMLSTTSYLLAFYTVIFGILMMGVGFISSQLTSPLEEISNALKRISGGNLDTKLPVRSEDEIGTLTKAYNLMAGRLKSAQKELAKNEREAAWKEMAQQIAHEIKNPLTPMKLNLQHLERQFENSENDLSSVKPKVSKIASNMIEQIDSLNKIASDFSNFAKPVEHEFHPLDLNELVRSVVEMYSTDESFNLFADLAKNKLMVSGAKEELRRVLINLIKNASEALGENGRIDVTAFSDKAFTNAFVTVTDNGEGISSEDLDKIFVPSFSTKSSGTGLGLAITKKIIEEHDGEITFISTKGQGTSFTIRIPVLRKVPK